MLFKNSLSLNNYINRLPKGPIGLIPTMGSIHEGHQKIINKCLNENLHTIVSIFINPTQFDEFEDYINYPRDIKTDIKILNSINKSILVYSPESYDLYGDNVKHDFFNFDGERYKILRAKLGNRAGRVGEVLSNKLEIACGNNESIKILEIQRQGKKLQKVEDFMLGSNIKKGSLISNA